MPKYQILLGNGHGNNGLSTIRMRLTKMVGNILLHFQRPFHGMVRHGGILLFVDGLGSGNGSRKTLAIILPSHTC